jgi:hypothetical protein
MDIQSIKTQQESDDIANPRSLCLMFEGPCWLDFSTAADGDFVYFFQMQEKYN